MTRYSAAQNRVFRQPPAGFCYVEGIVTGAPRALLRVEGGLALAAAGIFYSRFGFDWKLFGILFLAPDLSMLGYLAGPKIGSAAYNLVHNYALPFALYLLGLMLPQPLLAAISLILIAHTGFDRMLGYGLKYSTGFGDTHLGKVGKSVTLSSSSAQ